MVAAIFEKLGRDVTLHLAEVKAYKSGIVELRYDVRGNRGIGSLKLALTFLTNIEITPKRISHGIEID